MARLINLDPEWIHPPDLHDVTDLRRAMEVKLAVNEPGALRAQMEKSVRVDSRGDLVQLRMEVSDYEAERAATAAAEELAMSPRGRELRRIAVYVPRPQCHLDVLSKQPRDCWPQTIALLDVHFRTEVFTFRVPILEADRQRIPIRLADRHWLDTAGGR